MRVPQLEPFIGKDEYAAIKQCFDKNWITEGPLAKEFSTKLLELIGSKYGVFAPNGTLALYLGLRAVGVGPGDEVIVPDFTFIASATSVEMTGAVPMFVDVNRKNFQIDLRDADKLITKRTKAIMPVHIYGTIADMDSVMKFAKKHNLKVIEDAAEAIGVTKNGKHAGTFGEVGCFSFFADKTITTAEGGFVVTDDEKVYKKLLYLRNQGRLDRGSFIHPEIGYNFRMTDVQCAIGLVQLNKLEEIKDRKKKIIDLYKKYLKNIREITYFEPDQNADWIPFRMGILVKEAKELMSFMKSKDIEPRTFFYPLHKQPAFKYLRNNDDSFFANSIYAFEHGICLPAFPSLKEEQVAHIAGTIKEFFERDVFYKSYDILYKDKDYTKETNLIWSLARENGIKVPRKILEIGCGTGNHTLQIAKKGVNLVAIDTDMMMTNVAKEKLKSFDNVNIVNEEVEKLEENNFDIATAMFNVVTYISDLDRLESFFKSVFDNLRKGGIFIFDCWNGIAAINDPPKVKEGKTKNGKVSIDYKIVPKKDLFNQTVELKYDLNYKNGPISKKGTYKFNQTLWTPKEIKSKLDKSGFDILSISPFMEPKKKATEESWKIMFVCKKS